ncbi:MAG: hypothetical protein WKF55_05895 [Gemmatimonadaceae bacterium]
MTHPNSFGSKSTLEVGGRQYTIGGIVRFHHCKMAGGGSGGYETT